MIPNYIFQTWKVKTNLDPVRFKYVETVKKYNKNMKHYLYDDQDCDNFVKNKFPEYYYFYQQLQLPVQKADLWRYLIIYYYGGYYLDIDCVCVKSFSSVVPSVSKNKNKKKNLLIIEIENPVPFKPITGFPRNPQYAQYWFGATPRHPVILDVIEQVIKNISNNSKRSKSKNFSNDNVTLFLTGPVPWTDAIQKTIKSKSDTIYKIQPNRYDIISVGIDTQLIHQYKNTPVIHKAAGSWRSSCESNNNFIIKLFLVLLVITLIVFLIKHM